MQKTKMKNLKNKINFQSGFTLVEMITAVAIFALVMVVGMGALLNVLNANRKAHSIQTAVNNLNLAMEMMSREIRTGYNYHCGESGVSDTPRDCPNGDDFLAFEPYNGDINLLGDQVVFKLMNGSIEKSLDGGSNFLPVTAEELVLEDFYFAVIGTSKTDNVQPKVLIVAKGYVGKQEKYKTYFNLQTTVSQRAIDF